MKFGKISLFIKKSDDVSPPQNIPTVPQNSTGLGQQHIEPANPNQNVSQSPTTEPSSITPKKRSLFKTVDDARRETTVFSSMQDILAVTPRKRVKPKLEYKLDKEEYQKRFQEESPLLTNNPKVIATISKFLESTDPKKESPIYKEMKKEFEQDKIQLSNDTKTDITITDIATEPVVIKAGDILTIPKSLYNKSIQLNEQVRKDNINVEAETTGMSVNDFVEYLKEMDAYNDILARTMSQISETGIRVIFDVKNTTDKDIAINDIDREMTIPKGQSISITNKDYRQSRILRESMESGDLTFVDKSTRTKWTGFISPENFDKFRDYLQKTVNTYNRYQNKGLKPFEYKLNMHHLPDRETFWRDSTIQDAFRVSLDLGDIVAPVHRDYVRRPVNEHFDDNIAFGIVHEMVKEGKKIWIVDEYQSDLTQQVTKMSKSPGMKTWYNPKGLSLQERYKSEIDNYYGDWYRVFLNLLIKKAKSLGVDELWFIKGEDIFKTWYREGNGPWGNLDDIEQERVKQLFRRVYDGPAIEYSEHLGEPEKQKDFDRYNELYSELQGYFRDLSYVRRFAKDWKEIPDDQKMDEKEYGELVKSVSPYVKREANKLQLELDKIIQNISELESKKKTVGPEIQNRMRELGIEFGKLVQQSKSPGITPEQKTELETRIQQIKTEREELKKQMEGGKDVETENKIAELKAEQEIVKKELDEDNQFINKSQDVNRKISEILEKRNEMDSVMKNISNIKPKTKDMAPEIYRGQFHVIDVNKVPDEKLAKIKMQLTKYADMDFSEWGEKAYSWIQSWIPDYERRAKEQGEHIPEGKPKIELGMEWFWRREVPRELKTDRTFLIQVRDYLRNKYNMPDLDWVPDVKLYIEGRYEITIVKHGGDNPDPSYEDPQKSPMETSMENRLVNPDDVIYRRKKGRGALFGDPGKDGDLRCNLPASDQKPFKTASDVVERFLITREKQHASEPQIKEELLDRGITEKKINETYKTRDKNLIKETK